MLPHSSSGGAGPPDPPARGWRTWFDAWVESAYGADGFWRIHSPDAHFRTAATNGPMIAQMLAALVDRHDEIAHVIDVGAANLGASRRMVAVEVGKDTQADLIVGVTLSEQLTVTAAAPVVDVRSVEVSFNIQAETFNALPIERTYRGLFQCFGPRSRHRPFCLLAAASHISPTGLRSRHLGDIEGDFGIVDLAAIWLKDPKRIAVLTLVEDEGGRGDD